MDKYVIAKCVCCGATRRISAGEVPNDEVPMCEQCGCPMVAKQACAVPDKEE